jgi:hypothetical protein
VAIAFLADEDLNRDIIEMLLTREPSINVLDIKETAFRRFDDDAILELAASEERIVISHDRNTMTKAFVARLRGGQPTTGLLIVPQRSQIGPIVESLVLIWSASSLDDWRYSIEFLPLR